jgi:hypothetical protein
VASSILLIADDEFTLGDVKHTLLRMGLEVLTCASAAEAVQLFGEHLPALVLLDPTVESGRGEIALKALRAHPEAALLRLVLLGESIAGFALPVEPLPVDLTHFESTIRDNLRSGDVASSETWSNVEPTLIVTESTDAPARAPPPAPTAPVRNTTEAPPPSPPDPSRALERVLFGDIPSLVASLHQDVEAHAVAQLENALARGPHLSPAQPSAPKAEAAVREEEIEDTKRVSSGSSSSTPRPPSLETAGMLERAARALNAAIRTSENNTAEQERQALAESELVAQLNEMRRRAQASEAALEALRQQHQQTLDALTSLQEQHQTDAAQQAERSAAEHQRVHEALGEMALLHEKLARQEADAEALRQQIETLQSERSAMDAALHTLTDTNHTLEERWQQHRHAVTQAEKSIGELTTQLQLAHEAAADSAADFHRTSQEKTALLGQLAQLSEQLTAAADHKHQALDAIAAAEQNTARLELLLQQLESEKNAALVRAEGAELAQNSLAEQLENLQNAAVVTFSRTDSPPLTIERQGVVGPEGLSRTVRTLVQERASMCLEITSKGQLRRLAFENGLLTAASSSAPGETIFERAHRDGLIDQRALHTLAQLGIEFPQQQIELLLHRSLLRKSEVEPLRRRYVDLVAIEALSGQESRYFLKASYTLKDGAVLSEASSVLPLLTEALRRAITVEALSRELGSAEAVVHALEVGPQLGRYGFSEKELRLFEGADGEATVDSLLQLSRMRPEQAWRTFLVAKWLGIVTLTLPAQRRLTVAPDIDISRLENKFHEIQDADYFTILGLPRHANAEDVRRSFAQLSQEFHPLKYVGLGDAQVQHRAQVVLSLIEEAARSLEDDGRRQEYARHLTD